MESFLHPSSEDIRISTSPRRSPQITEAVSSPARSHYPQIQQMDSMHTQPDYGLRTTDFFDDSSDDNESVGKVASVPDAGTDDDLLPRKGSTTSATRRRSNSIPDEPLVIKHDSSKINSPTRPDKEGYQPLMATAIPEEEDDTRAADASSSSLVGSVDELLPGGTSSPPQFPERPRKASIRPTSSRFDMAGDRTSKLSQTLGAYAIAHEITLQALMRDESALDSSFTQQFQHAGGNRQSMLPSFSTPTAPPPTATTHHESQRFSSRPRPISSSTARSEKKVHVIPPPIDTDSTNRKSIPIDIVRTPYPYSPETAHQKVSDHNSNPNRTSAYAIKPISTIESVLTVSIRPSNKNCRRRVTTLTIPASSDFSVVRSHSPRSKEQHFQALNFDDEALFRQLRRTYNDLVGPWRWLSARSLQRISVAGEAMREVDRGYWIHNQPLRTPRLPGSKSEMQRRRGGGDFREERVMQYFSNPALGRSRYTFVHWAHRLASAPPSTSLHEHPRRDDTAFDEGLEFVLSWSLPRIALAFILVMLMSVAATLLWVFLGHVSIPPGAHGGGGFRNAGDRVTSGVVLGICLLLLGLSGLGGWLGVSWLVM